MNIFETLKKLSDNQRKQESKSKHDQTGKRKEPCGNYLDEKDNQIKEIPLKLDSAGALINRTIYKNPARLIRDSIFGK
jgi:hypothetical protein